MFLPKGFLRVFLTLFLKFFIHSAFPLRFFDSPILLQNCFVSFAPASDLSLCTL